MLSVPLQLWFFVALAAAADPYAQMPESPNIEDRRAQSIDYERQRQLLQVAAHGTDGIPARTALFLKAADQCPWKSNNAYKIFRATGLELANRLREKERDFAKLPTAKDLQNDDE